VPVWPRSREGAAAVKYLVPVWPRGREGAAVPPTAAAWPRCDPHLLGDTARVSGRVSWHRTNKPCELEGIARVVFVFLLVNLFMSQELGTDPSPLAFTLLFLNQCDNHM
jgi:hypothetical protein